MSTRILRRHALSIFKAAVDAADPAAAVVHHLERLDTARFRKIYVVGAGKAGASMAAAAESVLGRRIAAGLVNVKYGHVARLRRIELQECGHPIPDQCGAAGARRPSLYFSRMAAASAKVLASGAVGPEPITPGSSPMTSESSSDSTRAGAAKRASCPPLIREMCLRTVLIS